MHISSGYLRRFCSFDGGDTTGSFLGPRGVSFFPSAHLPVKMQIASVNIIVYTPWVPLPLNPTVYPCFSRRAGKDSFRLLQVGG
jgi:hypothetical protein